MTATEEPQEPLKVLDTFAGAGGFSLGFQLAGFEVIGAIEVDEWACETFAFNHPKATTLQRDICEITGDELRSLFDGNEPNVVIGGPPCQGFSIANNRGGDPRDPRNSLFSEFLRVGEVFRPRLMVLENVPNLATARTTSGDNVLEIIKQSLKELGYHTYSMILQATSFGVPQIRQRLFVIGSRIPLTGPFPQPTHSVTRNGQTRLLQDGLTSCPSLWDAISDLPPLNAREGAEELPYVSEANNSYQAILRRGARVLYNHKAMRHSTRTVERFSTMKCGDSVNDVADHLKPRKRNSSVIATEAYDQNNRRMYPDRPCHTIPASFYANFVHPFQHRNFTAREGARIQSFPDWYRFMGKPTVVSHKLLTREERHDERHLCQYNQIGNAVPPLLATAIAHNLRRQLERLNQCSSTAII